MAEWNFKKALLAPCGFYCGSCPTHLKENCPGCLHGGAGNCYCYQCVTERDLRFCGECERFPCEDLFTREKATLLSKEWLKWKKREQA